MELSASMDLSDADGLPVSIYDIHLVDETCLAIIGGYAFVRKSHRRGFSGMVVVVGVAAITFARNQAPKRL